MGSVIDIKTCPKCGCEEMNSEYFYKTDETYDRCPICGFYFNRKLNRNAENEVIFKTEKIEREDVRVFKNSEWVSPDKDEDLSLYLTRNFKVKNRLFPSFAAMNKDGTEVTYPDYIIETGGGYGAVHVKYDKYTATYSLREKDDPEIIKKEFLEKDNDKEIKSITFSYPEKTKELITDKEGL